MAYRKTRAKRRYSAAPAKSRRRVARPRRRKATPRNQRITIVLQQAPTGMMAAGLTLGKKNYTPVRAKY